ncbi:MAG: substrate-binding domain-containing protein [Actinomycetota bacterium]
MKRIAAEVLLVALIATGILVTGCGTATVTVATTGETASSPLYGMLVEQFEEDYGIKVETKTFGSSREVLEAGARGEADALLVSNKMALDEWMKQEYALSASDVFYSDFIVVGPESDPAQIKGLDCPGKSCKKIGTAGADFVCCGDGSDLDAKVMGYWNKCGVNPEGQAWFTRTGEDMEATLAVADGQQAYTVCDMSTWLENKDSLDLAKLVEGCTMLMNQYSLVVIDPALFPEAEMNVEGAQRLAEFLVGESGQEMIGSYEESGVVIYHPNATQEAEEEPMNM